MWKRCRKYNSKKNLSLQNKPCSFKNLLQKESCPVLMRPPQQTTGSTSQTSTSPLHCDSFQFQNNLESECDLTPLYCCFSDKELWTRNCFFALRVSIMAAIITESLQHRFHMATSELSVVQSTKTTKQSGAVFTSPNMAFWFKFPSST